MKIYSKTKTLINQLIGNKLKFNLEERILHTVLIVALLAVSINAVFNFLVDFISYAFIMIGCFIVLAFTYYLSRIKKQLVAAIHLIAILGNFACITTYFQSNGSAGPNLYTFIALIFMLSFISPKKVWRIWIPITFLTVLILFVLEYKNPHWVENLYSTPSLRVLDVVQTWFEASTLIALLTVFIKYYYYTEKRLAQSRLQALEQINEHKNKLFSIISHDLRSPLASIENYLSNLNQIDITPEEKRYIEQNLLQNTRQTSQMLQNMLHWSKDQMSGIHVNIQTINLLKSISSTLELSKIIAEEKNIGLEILIDKNINVIADVNLLQIVVRNLLNNAVKFSNPKGIITINAKATEDEIVIKVIDSGVGIDPKLINSLFELNKVSSVGTNQEQGVGLGLVLTKNYVEMMGGKIWFKNNKDHGTTFYFTIPLG